MRKHCVHSAAGCSSSSSSSLFSFSCALTGALRLQSSMSDKKHRATSHNAKRSAQHPLSAPSPGLRNIVVPDSVHASRGQPSTIPAEWLQKRAQRMLALQIKKDMLWEGTAIDDASHKIAQHFLLLRTNPKYQMSKKLLIVGGKHFIRELCEQGRHPTHLLIPSNANAPEWANRSKTEVVLSEKHVTDEVVPGTDGYVADFEFPDPPPKEQLIANKQRMERVLVLDNIDDPGTLGTMLRTAAGFSYDAVILVNHCADLYDAKVVRAARGAHFQSEVPFYQLREEDGDDAFGMVRHIMQRNELDPIMFTPTITPPPPMASASSSPPATDTEANPSSEEGETNNRKVSADITVKKLSSFCLEEYARVGSSTGEEKRMAPGHILFAGPDHRQGSLEARLKKNIPKRITKLEVDALELESGATNCDMVTSLSCVLYALRPSGNWDYLPESHKSTASHASLQNRSKVDIGPDRLLPIQDRDMNLNYEEQVAAAHRVNEQMRQRRLQRRQLNDYGAWMTAEHKRIKEMAEREQIKQSQPWVDLGNPKEKGADGLPDMYPNIINDYRQPLDRESLREEAEDMASFSRAPNYDARTQIKSNRKPK